MPHACKEARDAAPQTHPRDRRKGTCAHTTIRKLAFRAYGCLEGITVETETQIAEPGAGMARIKVETSSLMFTDILIRRNLYPMLKALPGETLGYDLVRRVGKLGPYTIGPALGTLVATLTRVGGGQDWVILPVAQSTIAPHIVSVYPPERVAE